MTQNHSGHHGHALVLFSTLAYAHDPLPTDGGERATSTRSETQRLSLVSLPKKELDLEPGMRTQLYCPASYQLDRPVRQRGLCMGLAIGLHEQSAAVDEAHSICWPFRRSSSSSSQPALHADRCRFTRVSERPLPNRDVCLRFSESWIWRAANCRSSLTSKIDSGCFRLVTIAWNRWDMSAACMALNLDSFCWWVLNGTVRYRRRFSK